MDSATCRQQEHLASILVVQARHQWVKGAVLEMFEGNVGVGWMDSVTAVGVLYC